MSEIFRWGMLGCASIGDAIANGMAKSEGNRLEAVASRDINKAKAWAAARGVPLAFGSYDELLRSGAVDLVYNPLPNSLHAEWTIRALEAGLPVLCEKPLAVNAAQAREVAEASRRTGLPVIEAFAYRYHPIYGRIRDLIRAGAIGRVVSVYSVFTWFLENRSEIPASADLAGGSLMDVGCYCVNVSRMIAGCEPARVFAYERRTSVDDTMIGLMEFPNGILAEFECSMEAEERRYLEIKGTGGLIAVENPWNHGENEGRFILRRGGKDEVIVTPGANGYHLEIEDLAQAFAAGAPTRFSLEDSIANMAAIDALYASAGKNS